MKNPIKIIMIAPVKLYQWTISPLLGPACRYVPTCSEYTIQAIEEWGPVRGSALAAKRIASCNPWGGSGYDPVPKNPNKETTDKRKEEPTTTKQ